MRWPRIPAAALCGLLTVASPAGALDAVVDVNGDGLLVAEPGGRAPADRPTVARPFLFWVNHDQDDLEDGGESWPIERADGDTPEIDSLRDLEDFARVRIDLGDAERNDGRMVLRWRGEGTVPRINLYRAADARCTRAHVLDPEAAARQLAAPFGTRLGVVGEAPLELALAELAADASLCLLFDVARGGTATLELRIAEGDGADASAAVPMELRHVKTFYERRAADWPEEVEAPWNYVETAPPVPELEPYVDRQGYDFVAPWSETDEVIVWVYGWLRSGKGLYEMATTQLGETVFKRLWQRGYRGRLLYYRWPTEKPRLSWGLLESEYRAYKSAPALLEIVEALPPGKRVHVTGHSLGAVVLAEALHLGLEAEQVLIQVGAFPAGAFDDRPRLVLADMSDAPTPQRAEAGGYEGYLAAVETPVDAMVNFADVTFFGWNLAQKRMKPTAKRGGYRYRWDPDAPPGQRARLEGPNGASRIVEDPHEVMAFVARSRTHAIGAEKRVRGNIRRVYDLARPPYRFGTGHVVGWTRPAQETTAFYTLLLDSFGIPYVSEQL